MATISSSTSAVFTASGLASGMDTASIVDKLVQLESAPIAQLQTQQAALRTQLSTLGTIVSKLGALRDAATALQTNGVLAASVASSNTTFSAVPGSSAIAGRYAVQVQALARAAQARSAAFASSTSPVAGGTLSLTIQGAATPYTIKIVDGTSLSDVAAQIRASGAPISATVLSDGTASYLSLTNRDTGFPITGAAADALKISFTADAGATGKDPALAITTEAQNAKLTVDGLTMYRTSNTVSDAIPGTTLTLKSLGAQEDLVVATDPDGTAKKLQQFVTAYNDVVKLVQGQLSPTKDTDRAKTLAGDRAIRDLQSRLQRLTSTSVPELASRTVRSLADLGVKTARDGTLSIDTTTLTNALQRDPQAANAVFGTATTGLGAVVSDLVDAEVRSGTGVLTSDQKRLNDTISSLDLRIEAQQRRVESYRATLVAQFTAMEKTVSSLKAISAFLTSQDKSSSSS